MFLYAEPLDYLYDNESGKAVVQVKTPPEKVKTAVPSPPIIEETMKLAADRLDIPHHSFYFKDRYGKIATNEDLQRAIHNAKGDCNIDIVELNHYQRLRALEKHQAKQDIRMAEIEASMKKGEQDFDDKIQQARDDAKADTRRLEKRVDQEVRPVIDALVRDKNRLQNDVRIIEEKISELDIAEMKEIAETCKALRDEVKEAVRKVNEMQAAWAIDKQRLNEMGLQCQQDLHELQRYLQGKIDVCIEADADLRREQQLCNERMQIVADDVRLLTNEARRLMRQVAGALEESEELRTLLGQVREDNEHLRSDHGNVKTRVHCIEGQALEVWKGFMPGVLYFKQWHRIAKGPDIQLSKDLTTGTGRGFMAVTGLVVGNNEGLLVADGPCRRFGTPGMYSSYFEVELTEAKTVPDGMGGFYVGMSLQSSEEIAAHPQKEFDGWLLGGGSKALVCRAGTPPDLPVDPNKVPGTFAPGASEGTLGNVKDAMSMLRKALPPREKGEMREFGSSWNSQHLKVGDRIGVLFRCNRDIGARLRISVNGEIMATQEFSDAPTAEAVGFFTPVVRIAGSTKTVKLLPGLTPPSAMLAG